MLVLGDYFFLINSMKSIIMNANIEKSEPSHSATWYLIKIGRKYFESVSVIKIKKMEITVHRSANFLGNFSKNRLDIP